MNFPCWSWLYGGVSLIGNNAIGMLDNRFEGTSFSGWLWPGLLLLVAVALPMGIAVALELRRSPWAAAASVVAGATLISWIGARLAIMQPYNFQQPIMLGCGLAVVLLALWETCHRCLLPPRCVRRPEDTRGRQWVGDRAVACSRCRGAWPPSRCAPVLRRRTLEVADEH